MKDILMKLGGRRFSRDDGYDTDGSDGHLEELTRKLSIALSHSVVQEEADFGILFDIDGVLVRGSKPLTAAIQAIRALEDDDGILRVPIAFVTNSCNRSQDKANLLKKWLNIEVTTEQVVHAPTPCKLLKDYHHKHTLVIGQQYREDISRDLGFTNICTIEDIQHAYPLLDMVDHDHRRAVAKGHHPDDPTFPPIEVILLIGEPTRWESHLQLLIDILVTGGTPSTRHVTTARGAEGGQIPVIACNMDLVFMHQACMPRFGHGAFLICLEALYKKITGHELEYQALVGKPCEITYRYAEHVIANAAKRLGIHRPLKKLYFIGDNANVDIVGANLYNRYLQTVWKSRDSCKMEGASVCLPPCRTIPLNVGLTEQTVREMESILVGTGVYKHGDPVQEHVYHGHRDFLDDPTLTKPSIFVPDVYQGIQHILKQEDFNPNHVCTPLPSASSQHEFSTDDIQPEVSEPARDPEHRLRTVASLPSLPVLLNM